MHQDSCALGSQVTESDRDLKKMFFMHRLQFDVRSRQMMLDRLLRFVLSFAVISSLPVRCDVLEPNGHDEAKAHLKRRPFDGGKPVDVRIGVYVESLGAIRETTMDFSLTMYFRERWDDHRLTFNGTREKIYVGDEGDVIWSPDLFFLYEKEGRAHDITRPNVVIKIQPDGAVFRSSRLTVTSSCYMDLRRFPFDSQLCSLNIMSYSFSTRDMTLNVTEDDVAIEQGLTIPSFILTGIQTTNQVLEYTTGSRKSEVTNVDSNYSLAKVSFAFQRQMQSYLLTVYIPSILLVTLAWISFCIDAQAAPARVSLGITTVLTITTMTSGIQESLPVVTYAKAIDIWLAACLVFVFLALLEYALANYLLIQQKRADEARLHKTASGASSKNGAEPKTGHSDGRMSRYKTEYYSMAGKNPAASTDTEKPSRDEQWVQDHSAILRWTPRKVDRIARYVYPIAFLIFNMLYWPIFLFIDNNA